MSVLRVALDRWANDGEDLGFQTVKSETMTGLRSVVAAP